jgi:hypothetical protein
MKYEDYIAVPPIVLTAMAAVHWQDSRVNSIILVQ